MKGLFVRKKKDFEWVQIKRGTLVEEFLNQFLLRKSLRLFKSKLFHPPGLILKSEMECTPILSMLGSAFVRNSKFLAAFFPAASQYPTAVGCCHALAEAVLVLSFSTRRLECTFHAL